MASGNPKRRAATLKLFLSLLLIAAALAPGVWDGGYWRFLTTAILLTLVYLAGRSWFAGIVSFRRIRDPPEWRGGEWPSITVLVPAYNEARVLPQSIETLRKVDYPADRIRFLYAYESTCTDATPALVQEAARSDPRFVALERKGGTPGKAAALNHALETVRSDIVLLLDADQVVAPDALRRVARWFQDPDVVCVKARPVGHNPEESVLALLSKVERDTIERGDTYARDVVGGFTFLTGGQTALRRDLLEAVGPFDERMLTEDLDYSVRIHAAGHGIVVDPGFVTREEHPSTFRVWWTQRCRWTRGGMQVARRYLLRSLALGDAGWRPRLGLFHLLFFCVLAPVFTLLPILGLLALFGLPTRSYLPPNVELAAWVFLTATPYAMWLATWFQDRRSGVPHVAREWLALPFAGTYMMLHGLVYWNAFLDEFVLQRAQAFEKTEKTGRTLPTEAARG